jgi:hypothetical protein
MTTSLRTGLKIVALVLGFWFFLMFLSSTNSGFGSLLEMALIGSVPALIVSGYWCSRLKRRVVRPRLILWSVGAMGAVAALVLFGLAGLSHLDCGESCVAAVPTRAAGNIASVLLFVGWVLVARYLAGAAEKRPSRGSGK